MRRCSCSSPIRDTGGVDFWEGTGDVAVPWSEFSLRVQRPPLALERAALDIGSDAVLNFSETSEASSPASISIAIGFRPNSEACDIVKVSGSLAPPQPNLEMRLKNYESIETSATQISITRKMKIATARHKLIVETPVVKSVDYSNRNTTK